MPYLPGNRDNDSPFAPQNLQGMQPQPKTGGGGNPIEYLLQQLMGGGGSPVAQIGRGPAPSPEGNPLEHLMGMLGAGAGMQPQGRQPAPRQNPMEQMMNMASSGEPTNTGTPGKFADFFLAPLGGRGEEQQGQNPMDYLAQLNDMLMGTIGSGGDLQAAIDQATGGINKAYGSQIGLLNKQNAGAKADTAHGQREIQNMYRALNREYQGTAAKEKKEGMATAAELERLGVDQAANINASAGDLLNKNAAASAGLESPELAAQLNAEVTKEAQGMGGRALSDTRRDATEQTTVTDAARQYMTAQGQNMNLEGTNRAADLFAQLQDFLDANRAKIGELGGQRAAALAQATAGIQGSYQDNTAKILQQVFGNSMDMAKFNQELQGGGGDDFSKMLNPNMARSSAILQANPAIAPYFNDLKDNQSMQQGWWGGPEGDRPMALGDNPAVLEQYVKSKMGDQWNQLGGSNQFALINALANLMQGVNPSNMDR